MIADFTEAIHLIPKKAIASSIESSNEAIRLNPKDAEAFGGRGFAYECQGENDKAITDYNEAIRLDPKLAMAYHYRAIVYEKVGKHEKAQVDFTEAKRLGFSPRSPVPPTPVSTSPLSSEGPLPPASTPTLRAAIQKRLQELTVQQQAAERRDSGEIRPQVQPSPPSPDRFAPIVLGWFFLLWLWSKMKEDKPKPSNAVRRGCLLLILMYPVVGALYVSLNIEARIKDSLRSPDARALPDGLPDRSDLNQENKPLPKQP